ncbi:MAG TPA: hypothetical protein VK453_07000 [Micromonosporaceae bacterium]|nr:hypothetical protein [Micromonosporaceae bacterium]
MGANRGRIAATRVAGSMALVAGVLLAAVGTSTDETRHYLVAGLLVVIGIGLRLEGAIIDRRRE